MRITLPTVKKLRRMREDTKKIIQGSAPRKMQGADSGAQLIASASAPVLWRTLDVKSTRPQIVLNLTTVKFARLLKVRSPCILTTVT